ncbi:MAG: DUF1697 domain-containing protein [Chloroflexota bacterium]
MTRYVAFLRAVNVGNRQMKMERLREQLELLGLENVATYIASGNAIFETDTDDIPALERRIEAQLEEGFGFDVPTLIRTEDELIAVANTQPFGAAADHDEAVVYVAFLRGDAPCGRD